MIESDEKRRILITGASRGIGRSVALQAAEAGADLVLVARTEADLAKVAEETGANFVVADVSVESDVSRLRNRVNEMWSGGPDILVNAAGSFSIASVVDTSPDEFDRQIAANLRGPFLMNRAFLSVMIERQRGHIVNVGSIAGRLPLPGNSAYGASKYGLRGFHEILVEELRGTGVRATMIEPAATDTALWDPIDPDGRDDLPSRSQMLSPDDVARAILFALDQPSGVEISHLAVRALG